MLIDLTGRPQHESMAFRLPGRVKAVFYRAAEQRNTTASRLMAKIAEKAAAELEAEMAAAELEAEMAAAELEALVGETHQW